MKLHQLKKTTNPFTFYKVEWQNGWDAVKQEVFLTIGDANVFASHLQVVKNIPFVHTYEVTEKLL